MKKVEILKCLVYFAADITFTSSFHLKTSESNESLTSGIEEICFITLWWEERGGGGVDIK